MVTGQIGGQTTNIEQQYAADLRQRYSNKSVFGCSNSFKYG